MCYSKGTWTKTDDLKGEFDTFLEAFANILDKNDCPLVIKDLMIEAKEKYDKKQDKESNQKKQRSGTALENQSRNCSQDSYSFSQSSIVSGQINFRESIFNDINVGEEFNDPKIIYCLGLCKVTKNFIFICTYQIGRNHDWLATGMS